MGFITKTTFNVVIKGRHSDQLIGKSPSKIQTQPNFHKVQSCVRNSCNLEFFQLFYLINTVYRSKMSIVSVRESETFCSDFH
jgi:hypothetical protein